MQNKKKKTPWFLLIVIGILLLTAGYYAAGAWQEGINGFIWYNNLMNNVLANPWQNYYNQYTIKVCLAFLFIYILVVLYYVTGKRNLMPGKEMGTAKFGNVKEINKKLSNKDFSKNNPKNIVITKKIYPKYWLRIKKLLNR